MMKRIAIFLLLIGIAFIEASAKFVQEVELKNGTVLVGYVYRQQPGKFMVFHVDRAPKDPNGKFMIHDKKYTLQWKDVKLIRHNTESETMWCNDRITLKDGTVYTGKIVEQEVGISATIKVNDTGKKVKVNNNDLRTIEKVVTNIDKDLWIDREYTNQLRLTDNSVHEGLITLQYRGQRIEDCYVELLHGSGFKERIYLPDIKEYVIKLQ